MSEPAVIRFAVDCCSASFTSVTAFGSILLCPACSEKVIALARELAAAKHAPPPDPAP